MTSTPEPEETAAPDERLLAARDVALAALHEITAPTSVGEPAGHRVERDGVVSLLFHNRMPGYPGWYWTVSLARVEDADPTVLEVELLPGDGALLAPDWVPWAVRLAEYQAAQVALAESAHGQDADLDSDEDEDEDDADSDEDDLDDIEDLDASDFDEDGSPILHAGDVDGVDIDELDPAAAESESDEDDEDDSEDDDESEEDDDEDSEESPES